MIVAKLRKALRHWPAEMPVFVTTDGGQFELAVVEVAHRAGRPVALRIVATSMHVKDFSPLLDWATVE